MAEKPVEVAGFSAKVIPDPLSTRRVAQLDIKIADVQRQLDEANHKVEELTKEKQVLEEANERLIKENKELRAKNAARKRDEAVSSKPKRSKSISTTGALPTASGGARLESSTDEQNEDQSVEVKIENLAKGMTSNALLALVEDYGRVASVRITRVPTSGELNGYCTFKSRANALRALDGLKANGHHASLSSQSSSHMPSLNKKAQQQQAVPKWRS